jgi:hypothetical protein
MSFQQRITRKAAEVTNALFWIRFGVCVVLLDPVRAFRAELGRARAHSGL